MILVDTSVWVDHFRVGNEVLAHALTEGLVLMHSFVLGELACGNLRKRDQILADLNTLPFAAHASHEEVMHLLDERKLWGIGIGWVDAHLLASTLLSGCDFWTLDQRLNKAGKSVGSRLYYA